MSRIGNKPITVPEGVEVKIDGKHITVKGPKGTLEREIHRNISLEMDGNIIKVTRKNDLMRIAVSDIERKKLTDIYEKMRKIMKESSKKRG